MNNAASYHDWYDLAEEHDALSGMREWRGKEDSTLYDHAEIRLRLEKLKTLRQNRDDQGLLFTLNEGIHGNMGGMGQSKLYAQSKIGTKHLIEEYVNQVSDSLLYLADSTVTSIALEDKIDFFKRASLCFGRSALMLSGGGQLGNFHIGVIQCLAEQELLPKVISGSSAGSIFAGLAGTRTNNELIQFLSNQNFMDQVAKEAVIFQNIAVKEEKVDKKDLESIINNLIPDLTFQEAFELTGRKINISVSPHGAQQKSRLLNAIASPNVFIRSAILASCAVPGIFPPVTLWAKNKDGQKQPYLPSRKWIDGSMSNDLPIKRLTRLYAVNHFIVSLTNPLVLPFISDPNNQNELLAPVKKLTKAVMKETTQFNYSIAKRFFRYLPSSVTFAANTINSVVQQDYIGDINIMADVSSIRPDKLLSSLSVEKLIKLIKDGEKATWPKIAAIKTTTQIGRVLDSILEDLEQEAQISKLLA